LYTFTGSCLSCTKQKVKNNVDYRRGQNRAYWVEVDFEMVNMSETEKCLEIDTEKCEFKIKFRTRNQPEANLFQIINKQQWSVQHF
jgi:hypothetical protein